MGIGSIVGGAFSVLQGGFGAIAGAAQSIGLPQQVQQQIQELTKPGGAQLTQAEQQQILQTARRFFDQDGPTPADRQQVAALLSQYANMSEPQARQMIDQWLENYEQATQALKEGAEKTAQTLGTAAFWSFIMLLLTGIAAAAGAAIGTRWRLT
jgi:hypothetical protein